MRQIPYFEITKNIQKHMIILTKLSHIIVCDIMLAAIIDF